MWSHYTIFGIPVSQALKNIVFFKYFVVEQCFSYDFFRDFPSISGSFSWPASNYGLSMCPLGQLRWASRYCCDLHIHVFKRPFVINIKYPLSIYMVHSCTSRAKAIKAFARPADQDFCMEQNSNYSERKHGLLGQPHRTFFFRFSWKRSLNRQGFNSLLFKSHDAIYPVLAALQLHLLVAFS